MKRSLPILLSLFLLFCATITMARDIVLQWDPNSETDLSGYKVHWGVEPRKYTAESEQLGLTTTYTLTLPDDGQIYYFAITANDTEGGVSDYSNEVNTNMINVAPIANAGANQGVMSGSIAELDGSASNDPNGDLLTYLWAQTGGITVTLNDATVSKPTFITPILTTQASILLSFKLTVTDTLGLQSIDDCTVTVINPNAGVPPKAPSNIRKK